MATCSFLHHNRATNYQIQSQSTPNNWLTAAQPGCGLSKREGIPCMRKEEMQETAGEPMLSIHVLLSWKPLGDTFQCDITCI